MPLSSAERCRKYREKLKQENPVKFEEMKKKNSERTKAKKRKIADMEIDEKEKVRQQWREAKKCKKLQEEEIMAPQVEQVQKVSQVGRENLRLKEKVKDLYRRINCLRTMVRRSKQKNNSLTAESNELKLFIFHQINSDSKKNKDSNELSPLTKSNDFIEKHVPDISEEAKERIKKTILERYVLEDSLKETYKDTKEFQGRNIFKKLTESEVVKKYKMMGNVSNFLGFKGKRIRKHYSFKQQREKTVKDLRKFFERDDVSRMTAGKKEYLTQSKIHKQKRFLLDTLLKLYKKYKNEGGKASFTTFKRYRPFYVVSPNISNRDTCACIKHSNLALKAEALKKSGVIQTTDLTDLVSEIVCDVESKTCMYSECRLCSDKKLDVHIGADNQEVTWFEFKSKIHEYEKSGEQKVTKKIVKEEQTGSLNILAELMQIELDKFKVHHFNISHQYKQYKEAIDKIQHNEVILHCDFSENYVCKMAEEVQSMHFGASKTQFTLHTGVLYIKNNKPISFCTISPSLKHDPEAIWGHLKPVMDFVKESFPTINRIHFWSDGPTTQYRQKKNFFLFCEKTKELGFDHATWSFFEASHGKGAADGVGGAIKRTLDARVAYGEDIVDAKSAFDILSRTETSIKVFYVSDQAIQTIIISSPEKILPVPSTMKIHQAIVTENIHNVKHRPLSCFCNRGSCDCFATKTHNLKQPLKKMTTTRRTRRMSLDSSDTTDTEIQYAESDMSDWNEVENINSNESEEQQTYKEQTEATETRSETKNHHDLSTEVLTEKRIAKINKENKEKCNGVKILAEVRNTAENLRNYFNIQSFEKLTLTKVGLEQRLNIKRKGKKENVGDQTNPIPSTSSIQTPMKLNLFKNKEKSGKNESLYVNSYKEETLLADFKKKYIKNDERRMKEMMDEEDINDRNAEKDDDDIDAVSNEVREKIVTNDIGKPKENEFTERQDQADLNDRNVEKSYDDLEAVPSEVRENIVTNDIGKPETNEFTERRDEEDLNDRNVEESDDDLVAVSSEVRDKIITNDIVKPKGNEFMEIQDEADLNDRTAKKDQDDVEAVSSEVEGKISINDTVLVRYYIRKTWKYYVGFVNKIEIHDDETLYTVTFLKTVKTPKLKFIIPKKVDLDIITNVSIVKKISLIRQSKDYFLINSIDNIYF